MDGDLWFGVFSVPCFHLLLWCLVVRYAMADVFGGVVPFAVPSLAFIAVFFLLFIYFSLVSLFD